ncbi:MAG: Rpn family recombination-promoting nuclease/putative transposase [Planctomycetes bacterium]|nr:Rpn family recombination-promoting nuclease/putative transposase [Planctomycetota bacterium]
MPHDHLFRTVFSEPEFARALLAGFLPDEIAAAVDWDSLKLVPGTFLDELSREQQVDLLFSVRIAGKPALIYILLEHKSVADRHAALQLLGYVVQIWRVWRREHPGEDLPRIVPIVMHHGSRPWTSPRSIEELLDQADMSQALARRVRRLGPRFRFLVVDLAALQEDAIATRVPAPEARLVLLVMRFAQRAGSEDAVQALVRWRQLIVLAARHPKSGWLAGVLWSYFLDQTPVAPERLHETLQMINDEKTARTFVSAAEQLIARGKAEGKAEGRTELLLRQLRARFGTTSDLVEARVRAASPAELDEFAVRVLDAPTIDAVFARE